MFCRINNIDLNNIGKISSKFKYYGQKENY